MIIQTPCHCYYQAKARFINGSDVFFTLPVDYSSFTNEPVTKTSFYYLSAYSKEALRNAHSHSYAEMIQHTFSKKTESSNPFPVNIFEKAAPFNNRILDRS